MNASWCVLLLLVATVQAVNKCCPPGQSVVRHGDRYKCKTNEATRTLRSNRKYNVYRLPECPEKIVAENVTQESVPPNSCVDRSGSSDLLVLLYCSGDIVRNDSIAILTMQKCCEEHEVYNLAKHECEKMDANMSASDKYSQIIANEPDLIWFDVEIGIPRCEYALIDYSSDQYKLIQNKETEELIVQVGRDEIMFDNGSFCRDVTSDGVAVARVCHEHKDAVCSGRPCVRKCCPDGEIMLSENCERPSCRKDPRGFSPTFHELTGEEKVHSSPDIVKLTDYAILFGDPCLPGFGKFPLRPDKQSNENDTSFLSSTDGKLVVPLYGNNSLHGHHEYCMEEVFKPTCEGSTAKPMDGLYTFICFRPDDKDNVFRERIHLFSVGLIISCIFIFATMVVYLSLPKLQNLHGKTLLCYLGGMLAATVPLTYTQMNSGHIDLTACIVIGYIIYVTFLISFFWLNVMCFDIWWTFGAIRAMSGMKQKNERRRFMWYILYSLTFPLLLTSYTATMDFLDLYGNGSALDPEVGRSKCFFSNELAYLVHFSLPLMALSFANIIFFVLTARYCIRVKQEINRMQSGNGEMNQRFQQDKAKFLMTLKLFIVMGATWFLEFLSSTMKEPVELWYISDFMNAIQGVPIFCIFVLKRNVYELIKLKLGCGKIRRPSNVQITGTTTI